MASNGLRACACAESSKQPLKFNSNSTSHNWSRHFFPFRLKPAMAKRSVVSFVLMSCCVCLSMSIKVKRSSSKSIAGERVSCDTSEKDKEIMERCLESYKLGFDNLGPYIPGKDPPSCAVDLVSFHFVSHFEF